MKEKSERAQSGRRALTPSQLEETIAFFQTRLVGQPEAVTALTNVLYRQNALLKYALGQQKGLQAIPADPAVLLFVGGSWGKTLAARLIPMALGRYGLGSFTTLTPLPQDPEGTIYLDPQVVAVPFAVVLVEHLETAYSMNARFVANLAYILNVGLIPLTDEMRGMVRPVPLGLATFILTTDVGEKEVRKTLYPDGKFEFLKRQGPSIDEAYRGIQEIYHQALLDLPEEMLREVDETVIFRPLTETDLRKVFELEIENYEQAIFPGWKLSIAFDPEAKEHAFTEAKALLDVYGVHALRRELQRYIDPVVYRAYVEGTLTEEEIDRVRILVSLKGDRLEVSLA